MMGLETSHYSRSHTGGGIDLMRDIWPIEKIQAYLSWVRSAFKPTLSSDVMRIGQTYYARQRSADNKDAARTTARLAESFVRITQGHAKLMARHTCIIQDAIFAIVFLESSTFSSAIGGQRFPNVRSFFPTDPDAEYLQIEALILKHLGLSNMVKRTGGAPPSIPSTPVPPRVTGDHYEFPNPNNRSPPSNPSVQSMSLQQVSQHPTERNQHRPPSQHAQVLPLPQTPQVPTYKGSIPSIPLEFNDSVSESQAERIAGVRTATPLLPSAVATRTSISTVSSGPQQALEPKIIATTSNGHMDATSDTELIPLPPAIDGGFGVWESTTHATSLRIQSHDTALQASQMDVDDDFML